MPLSDWPWSALFLVAVVIVGLFAVLFTGEVIQWVLSGGRHGISLSNAIKYGSSNGEPFPCDYGDGSLLGVIFSLLLVFTQPPFLVGTLFWGFVFYIWWFYFR